MWSEGYLAIFFELFADRLSAVKVDKPGQGNSIERDWGLVRWVGFNSKSLLLHAGESFQMWKASKSAFLLPVVNFVISGLLLEGKAPLFGWVAYGKKGH